LTTEEKEKEKEKKKPGPKLHDWKKQIIPIDVTALFQWYKKNRRGKKPKVRALFYHLLQNGVIKIKSSVTYNTFSSEMSIARLESGLIPLDSLRDDVRPHVAMPDEREPEQVVTDAMDVLMNIFDYYVLYRWKDQPIWVEIWIEKDALQDDFQYVINKHNLQVVLQINRGQEGTSALREAYLRLARKQKEGKKVVILYFGDQDSDGEAMDDDILRRLKKMAIVDGIKLIKASSDMKQEVKEKYLTQRYGEAYTKDYKAGDNLTLEERMLYGAHDSYGFPAFHILDFSEDLFEFRRVALTDEQVNDPELRLDKLDEKQIHQLDWRSLRPMDRDFVNKHGSLYEVELDGLAIKPQFEDIIVDAVDGCYDWDLWENCVQYEVDGAFPKALMELHMLESLHELNMKFGYKNKRVKDHDIIEIREKAFEKVQKLRGRVIAIRGRYEGRPEHGYLKESYEWLARQEAKGRKIGREDLNIEEDD
jgi:hypothetical protein